MISEAHSTCNQTKLSGYCIVGVYMLTDFFFRRLALIWSASKYFVDSQNPRECWFWDCSFLWVCVLASIRVRARSFPLGIGDESVLNFSACVTFFFKFVFPWKSFLQYFLSQHSKLSQQSKLHMVNFSFYRGHIFHFFCTVIRVEIEYVKYFLLISFPLFCIEQL